MIKFLEITTDIQLENANNQLSSINQGIYEILVSNTTQSGYDFTIENDIITVGVYLADSQHIDFTTKLYLPFNLWGKVIFEHEPILNSIEEKLEYSFYNTRLANF